MIGPYEPGRLHPEPTLAKRIGKIGKNLIADCAIYRLGAKVADLLNRIFILEMHAQAVGSFSGCKEARPGFIQGQERAQIYFASP